MNVERFEERGQKLGARTAEAISSAVNTAGANVDAALDYMNEKKEQLSETLQRTRQEGWSGVQRKISDCVRNSPLSILCATMGVGVLVGWVLRRARR